MRWSTRLHLAQDPAISAQTALDLVHLCLPSHAYANDIDYHGVLGGLDTVGEFEKEREIAGQQKDTLERMMCIA